MTAKWKGVFPALTTKFNEDFSINHAEIKKDVNFQLDAGVDGLVMCGSLGENGALSFDEKVSVVKTAVEASEGRVPVLACVAETTTQKACDFAKKAEENGAKGLMVLPGMQYISDERETIQHLRTVAAATDLPIMIYNNPIAYRVDVTVEMFAELADEPKFVAIKESSDDIRRLTDLRNRFGTRYQILSGVDDLALESLFMGADGWLAGLVCAFPKETVAIYRLVQEGRNQEALKLYQWFTPLLHLDVSTKLVQNIKLVEKMVNGSTETVRAPRLPLEGAERENVFGIVKAALKNRPELPFFAGGSK